MGARRERLDLRAHETMTLRAAEAFRRQVQPPMTNPSCCHCLSIISTSLYLSIQLSVLVSNTRQQAPALTQYTKSPHVAVASLD